MNTEAIAYFSTYYIHAPFGGLALLAGGIALMAKKGHRLHKKSGIIFYYAMLSSALAALVISVLPNHENAFLFSIGIFSSYFLLSGYRSLRFKKLKHSIVLDKVIAYVIVITGIAMITIPTLLYHQLNIILLIFGIIGILFGLRDLHLFQDQKQLKKKWLKLHLGKMTGGYISAVTAFFVVNQILINLWNWFLPGVIGSIYIAFWIRKLKNRKTPELNN